MPAAPGIFSFVLMFYLIFSGWEISEDMVTFVCSFV